MVISNGRNTKEHEDESVTSTVPHLHEVLGSALRLLRNVNFYIAFHAHSTGNNFEEGKKCVRVILAFNFKGK